MNARKALRNLVGAALAAAALTPADARAFDPFLVTPDAAVAERSPAFRYANASDAERSVPSASRIADASFENASASRLNSPSTARITWAMRL